MKKIDCLLDATQFLLSYSLFVSIGKFRFAVFLLTNII